MPITPAHPAAVVPLQKLSKHLWLSPLVVGSMAPDYPYYLLVRSDWRHLGHTPLGLFYVCVPLGLAVLWTFHRFLKRPLAMLAPHPLRARLWPYCGAYPFLPLRRLAWIALLIYIGAVTHVLWDGVTHGDGWAVAHNRYLQAYVFVVFHEYVRVYLLLQYASSLLGLSLLAWWARLWYIEAPMAELPPDSPSLRRLRRTLMVVSLAFGSAVGLFCGTIHAVHLRAYFPIQEFGRAAFITGVVAAALPLLAYCGLVHYRDWCEARGRAAEAH